MGGLESLGIGKKVELYNPETKEGCELPDLEVPRERVRIIMENISLYSLYTVHCTLYCTDNICRQGCVGNCCVVVDQEVLESLVFSGQMKTSEDNQ